MTGEFFVSQLERVIDVRVVHMEDQQAGAVDRGKIPFLLLLGTLD
jgi:hypothetical protein